MSRKNVKQIGKKNKTAIPFGWRMLRQCERAKEDTKNKSKKPLFALKCFSMRNKNGLHVPPKYYYNFENKLIHPRPQRHIHNTHARILS